MKKTFVAALCLLTVGSMFGQKKAVDNAAKLAGKPNKSKKPANWCRAPWKIQRPRTTPAPIMLPARLSGKITIISKA